MNIIYAFGYLLTKCFNSIFRTRIYRLYRQLPSKDTALMIVSNHISYLDPPIVGASVIRRELNFMAKGELFSNPLFVWILRKINVFPVNRRKVDRSSLEKALNILRTGQGLVIFPEGTRRKQKDGKLNPGKVGVGMIAAKTNPTILPVYISGFEYPLKILLGQIRPVVCIGEPFRLESLGTLPKGKKGYKIIIDEIMHRIGKLKHYCDSKRLAIKL